MQPRCQATLTQPLQTRAHCKPAQIYAHGNTRWQQSCSHSTAICYHRFKKRKEIAEHRGGTNSRMKRPQPQPPHTRGTFHRRLQPLYTEKYKVSCSSFVPKTNPMQHSCSHYIALRSITWLTRISLRTWQHQMTTIMPPFHCDLQPRVQDTHRTTHTGTTTCCRTQRNQFARETTAAATAAHTRYLSSPAAATWHGKTPGFVLRLRPQNQPHATFMQSLQCVSQHHVANPHLSMHMATEHDNNHAAIPMRSATRDSRNAKNYAHRNNHLLQNTEEPIRAWNDRSRNRRTHEVPFIAGCSHFTRKNTRFRAPASSPMQHSCGHYNVFRSITWLTRISLRTWQQSKTTIMQPFQCDPQPEIQETQRTTHTGTTTCCRTQRNQFAHETTAAATAAHTRYLSSPAAATWHGKTPGFVLRLPPQHKPHATFMQVNSFVMYGYVV